MDGQYVKQEDISQEQIKEIGNELIIRLAEALGYVPAEEKEDEAGESGNC